MGVFNTVLVPCPVCGVKEEFQSKGGDHYFESFELRNCPIEVLADVNRHAPYKCECGAYFKVDLSDVNNISAVRVAELKRVEEEEVNNCNHPRNQRTFIGQNLLRCELCGEEFS